MLCIICVEPATAQTPPESKNNSRIEREKRRKRKEKIKRAQWDHDRINHNQLVLNNQYYGMQIEHMEVRVKKKENFFVKVSVSEFSGRNEKILF